MENINREAINKMLQAITERAKSKGWHAMTDTYAYKDIMRILSKEDKDIGYADREMLRNSLELLCVCQGLHYYTLVGQAYHG